MKARWSVRWTVVAAGALLLASCNSNSDDVADKAGSSTVVLQLATIDDVNSNGQSYGPEAFVEQLTKVSDGHLRVEVTRDFGDGAPDAEVRLVKAIASGEVDGGWPATRAFANAGIPGLQAIEAPLTLTSYAAEKALVTSPIATDVLAQLKDSGVAGLSLAVGPLRRPFAGGSALLEPQNWSGISFRTFASPVQDATVKALGATPVQLGFAWTDEVTAGTLRGAEFDIAQYAQNGRTTEAGMVTANVVLWPKMFVLSLSQKRFDSLTDQQREWVQLAAQNATQASVDATYDETTIARTLCDAGTRFVQASDDNISAMRTALAPVVDGLASDPVEGPVLAKIQQLVATQPTVDTPDVPESCRATTPPAPIDTLSTAPTSASELPDGKYRVEINLDEVTAAGVSNNDGWTGTWTMQVNDDGTFQVSCAPLDDPGHDCGGLTTETTVEAGVVHGVGNAATFQNDPEALSKMNGCLLPASTTEFHCPPDYSYTLTWAVEDDSLTFTDSDTSPHFIVWNWLLEPLTKIG